MDWQDKWQAILAIDLGAKLISHKKNEWFVCTEISLVKAQDRVSMIGPFGPTMRNGQSTNQLTGATPEEAVSQWWARYVDGLQPGESIEYRRWELHRKRDKLYDSFREETGR